MKKLLSAIAFAAFALSPAHAQDKHEDHAGHMLKGYIAVSDALYKDDLDAAKEAATGITKHDADSALAKPAAKLAEAEDMAAAREAFKMMSKKAIKMAKEHGDEYTVMHCPMVKGGGGDWLSADGTVNNPYFGPKMPHCGGPKQ